MSDSDGLGMEPAEGGPLGPAFSSWRRMAGEGAWALGGQVAVAVAGLVTIRLLTELAPKEVFGEASLVLGAMMLGRKIFLVPVWNTQLRFHPEYRQRGRALWFTRGMTRLSWTAAGVFAAAGACAYLVWRGLSDGGWRPLLALALAGILVTDVAKSLRLNRLNAERRQGRYALWTGAEAWLWPALAAVFLVLWTSTESYLWGQVAGSAVAVMVFGLVACPRIPPNAEGSLPEPRGTFLKKMLAYGLPLVPIALVVWATGYCDRYIVAGLMGKAEVGLYAAAYAVASRPFMMANGFLVILLRPVLFEAESRGAAGKARRIFLLWMLGVACVGALGVLGFLFLGERVAWCLLAAEYRAGAPGVFVWIAAGYAAQGLAQAVGHRLLSLRRSASLLLPFGLGAATNALLAFLLVRRTGLPGAAQAVAAGFLVRLAFSIRALGRTGAGAAGGEPGAGRSPSA